MSRHHSVRQEQSRKRISELFLDYISNHRPRMVSRHLRCIVLDYIHSQLDTGLPVDFDIYLQELYDLFALLDTADDEYGCIFPK